MSEHLVHVGEPTPPRCADGTHTVSFNRTDPATGERTDLCECGTYTLNELIRMANLNKEKTP